MDAHRVALDTTWDWAEMRGVRVDFWRNEDSEWEAMVTLHDTHGDFSESTPLPLFTPPGELAQSRVPGPKPTQAQLRDAYTKEARAALDDAVAGARARRGKWQRGRIKND